MDLLKFGRFRTQRLVKKPLKHRGPEKHYLWLSRCRKFDIVDGMLQKLEKYADNLENIVQQRTALLMDEKHKTDMLLYRMLPS